MSINDIDPQVDRATHFSAGALTGIRVLSLIFLSISSAQAANWTGILDPSRAVDWSQAGVPGGIPNRTTICATLNPGASVGQINAAIAACNNGVVFLNAGTYNLSAGILFSNKRNVTLRGAGANQTKLIFTGADGCGGVVSDICFINGSPNWIGGPGNIANWTGGYSQGATQIMLSTVANLQVGTLLNLDQLQDSSDDGTVFQAANATSNNCLRCNNAGRSGRDQTQIVKVTAISGTNVTIFPGLYLPNWRSDRTPQGWWSDDTPISGSGVEDLSADSSGVTNNGAVVAFYNAYGCWAKGIKSLYAHDSHIKFWQSAHNTVRDSYFFGNQVGQSQSYGTDTYLAADNLVENNIFQHVTVPNMNETSQGDVYGYNFSINNFYNDGSGNDNGIALHSAYTHAAGNAYLMWEGNAYDGMSLENFHGPAHFITAFRNRFVGRQAPKNDRVFAILNQSYQRYTNIVGNVLGDPTYHTNYTNKYGDVQDKTVCQHSIYAMGWSSECGNYSAADCSGYLGCPQPDSNVAASMLRWGNYDTVTAAVRWDPSEVPSALSRYANPVPSQTLPSSLYLSGKPGWWPASMAWPPMGPEVTGGNIPNLGGHANVIPSQDCYTRVMNGPADGSGNPLPFDAAACYAAASQPPNGATYYIDFTAVNDASNGTSTSTPWKHAPGMQGCSGNCAAKTPQPGDRFIFKGGVTWDHTCFEWDLNFDGVPGNPIYYGVDQTYHTGASWTRPIFSGDHTALAVPDSIVGVGHHNWITLDNIEIKGHRAPTNFGSGSIAQGCATYFLMENLYVHDWDLDPSVATDDAHGGIIGNNPSCTPTGVLISHSVISNIEARDAGKQNGIAVRMTDIEYSTIHDVLTAQLFGLMNNSEIYNISYPALGPGVVGSNQGFDPTYHDNATYVQNWDGTWPTDHYTRPGLMYNNVIHDFSSGSGGFYLNDCPPTGFYVFNNVVYNNFGNPAVQIDQYPQTGGTCGNYHIWNNTFEVSQPNQNPMRQVPRGEQINLLDTRNNHYIQDGGVDFDIEGGIATRTNSNNITQTHAQASAQGYVISNKYSPVSATGVTVDAGANLSALCVGAFTALCSDTSLGGARTPQARPSSGAWDSGAYEFASGNPTAPTISTFIATPATIASGASSTLSWTATGATGYSIDQGVGTVTGTSVSVSPTATTTYTLTATNSVGSATKPVTVTVTPPNAAPTVATPASATPSTVTGASTNLTVLGADDNSEAALIYTWGALANVTYSGATNGTNAAKTMAATFGRAGTYNFQVTIKDAGNLMVTSNVSVMVNQTLASITVAPANSNVQTNGTQQFTASAKDQFGFAMNPAPSFQWAVSGGQNINSATGLFTAGSVAGGPFNVTATASGVTSPAATVTVTTNLPPTVTLTSPTDGSVFTAPATINLVATAAPGTNPISKVDFYQGSTLIKSDTSSPYSFSWTNVAAGNYVIAAVVTDNQGLTNTSNVANITVNAVAPVITVQPKDQSVSIGQSATFTITATGNSLTYQWQYLFQGTWYAIAGANASGYTKTNAQLSDSGLQYDCVITNSGGPVTSNSATLTVTNSGSGNALPAIDRSNLPSSAGLNDSLNITNYPNDNVTFVWTFSQTSGNPYAAPALISSRASSANFTSGTKTSSMASYGLGAGIYQAAVQAVDINNPNNKSPILTGSITLIVTDFSAVKVYPNPWRKDKHAGKDVTFANLPQGSTVKLFTISGRKVKTLTVNGGQATWDVTNDSRDKVASGIYVYLITTGDSGYGGNGQKVRGKLAVVR
jgi:hypothetical protein